MNPLWFFEDVRLFDMLCPHKFKTYKTSDLFSNYHKKDYIYFENVIEGDEVGMNAHNLTGAFSLSNSIMVNRNQAEGGMISGGPFNFTIDATPNFVSGITLDGSATGTNST